MLGASNRGCRARPAARSALLDAGYTLPEMLVVMTLMAIVVAAAYLLSNAVQSMSADVDARSRAGDQTRIAMDRITRELRQTQEIVEAAGGFDTNGATDMRFFADVDGDSAPERVRYRVPAGGTALLRSVAQPGLHNPPYVDSTNPWGTPSTETTMCSLLDASVAPFRYYNRSDAVVATGTFSSISAVQVRLRNGATVRHRTSYVLMESWITLRAVNNPTGS